MRNIKLIIAYEGTRYLGWQKTKMGLSIEEELEKVLRQVLRHDVKLQAASRTDAGVHAEGQVCHFFTDKTIERLQYSLNSLLPDDISVLSLQEAPASFHPTLNSRGKEYHYDICLGPTQLPFRRHFSWHIPYNLDVAAMKQEAKHLVGRHDFAAFTNELQDDNVRDIHAIDIIANGANLKIIVSGNNFLYKMVRNIVGTLVYVGCKKLSNLSAILQSKDRTQAGICAPAHGLCLKKVLYDQ